MCSQWKHHCHNKHSKGGMLYFCLICIDTYRYIQTFVTYILYIFGGRSINLNAGRAHIICHRLGHHHSTSLTLKPRAALGLPATWSSWFWHQGQPTSDCEEGIARTDWFHPSRSCPHLSFVVGVHFVRVIAIVPWATISRDVTNLALKLCVIFQGDRVDVKSVVALLVRAGHAVALKTWWSCGSWWWW